MSGNDYRMIEKSSILKILLTSLVEIESGFLIDFTFQVTYATAGPISSDNNTAPSTDLPIRTNSPKTEVPKTGGSCRKTNINC